MVCQCKIQKSVASNSVEKNNLELECEILFDFFLFSDHLRPEQNAYNFAIKIFKFISLQVILHSSIKILLKSLFLKANWKYVLSLVIVQRKIKPEQMMTYFIEAIWHFQTTMC